jgi:hypothetical protein
LGGEVKPSGLTKRERDLLTAICLLHDDDEHGIASKAHPKHREALERFRAEGLVEFTAQDPRVRITPAGRAALANQEPSR